MLATDGMDPAEFSGDFDPAFGSGSMLSEPPIGHADTEDARMEREAVNSFAGMV